jgi:hypothetical protein
MLRHRMDLPERPFVREFESRVAARMERKRGTVGSASPPRQREALPEGRYHAVIDTPLKHGSLTYGEMLIPGRGKAVSHRFKQR